MQEAQPLLIGQECGQCTYIGHRVLDDGYTVIIYVTCRCDHASPCGPNQSTPTPDARS